MGSAGNSQEQQPSGSALKVSRSIHVLAADVGLKSIARDVALGECFYISLCKNHKAKPFCLNHR